MSKKSNLKILDDAVARIRKVIENDDGENPIFSQAMAINEKKWLDEFYVEATKSPKPAKKAAVKTKSTDKTDLSVRQN